MILIALIVLQSFLCSECLKLFAVAWLPVVMLVVGTIHTVTDFHFPDPLCDFDCQRSHKNQRLFGVLGDNVGVDSR